MKDNRINIGGFTAEEFEELARRKIRATGFTMPNYNTMENEQLKITVPVNVLSFGEIVDLKDKLANEYSDLVDEYSELVDRKIELRNRIDKVKQEISKCQEMIEGIRQQKEQGESQDQ